MATQGNQGTLLSTQTFSQFTDLVRRSWISEREFLDRRAKPLYITDPIGNQQGSSKRYNELDTSTFAQDKPEGTNNAKARTGVGYQKDMLARSFSTQIDITIEMRNQNRYLEVGNQITSLAFFADNRQDLDLTHRFTFAGSTSYVDMNGYTVDITTGDGLSLINTAHTLAFSSTTYSNNVAGNPPFSESSFQSALSLGANQIYNNFGELRHKNFNKVFCHDDPTTIASIQQLIMSPADVQAIQSGIVNTYKGTAELVVLPYLATTATGAYDRTKRRYWGIVAAGQGLMGWQGFVGDWVTPQLYTPSDTNNGMDINNLNWSYVNYASWGIATPTGKGIVMSLVVS